VRFFGGFALPGDLCTSGAFVADGYHHGVPMGSLLNEAPSGAAKPRFAISALKDAEGVDLQAVQIVKGWVDDDGTHEKVVTVDGNLDDGASVDVDDCTPTGGTGGATRCAVWTDDEFDPAKPAFWYVRVLENPTCRWHTRYCQGLEPNPVNPLLSPEECSAQAAAAGGGDYEQCCATSVEPVIRERAWTSPIFWRVE
jgi:hypothetical protein